MKKAILLTLVLLSFLLTTNITAQVDAKLMQNPDVSASQIVFAYGGDLWIVSKEGGLASKLSSPAGQELFPKFSPMVLKLHLTQTTMEILTFMLCHPKAAFQQE